MQHRVMEPASGERLNVLGDNQRVLLSGEQTGGAFTLIEQCNKPGVGVPPHVHDREEETWHVMEGAMQFVIDGKSVHAPAGTTVFVPRGVSHGVTFIGQPQSRALLIVTPAGLETMFRELHRLPAGPPDMGRVVEICSRYGIRFVPPT